MQYFLPFWPADGIHEHFNPWNDTWDGEKKRIWEVYEKPPIDGVLVSLENLKRNKKLLNYTIAKGIHSAIRYNGTIMADCGAFTYKYEDVTPKPIVTLENYIKYGFDIGVTVDHLIVNSINGKKLSEEQKYERWKLTLDNAEIMFERSRDLQFDNFRLIGVTQGYDINSYKDGVLKLMDIGYDYIALGGLVRKNNAFILNVLREIDPILKREVKIRRKNNKIPGKFNLHLFGIGRINLIDDMLKYGVTSFDNAFHRKAWRDSVNNYLIEDKYYTALRLRLSKSGYDQKLEEKIISYLRGHKNGELDSNVLLKLLHQYDPITTNLRIENYKKTLSQKPWLKCSCPLCADIGMHICILRGNERNMRRGFHNIYHFYNILRKKNPRTLTITWCTSKKLHDQNLLPAYLRYSASNTFRTFWLNVYDIPTEIGILSAQYGLIFWDTLIPYYEKRLTLEQIPNILEDLKNKLNKYDKIYFIGLGAYKKAFEIASKKINNIEIYPKIKYSDRNKLDIIEYNKQMKIFRNNIIEDYKKVMYNQA